MQPRAVVHVGDNPRAKRDEYCQEGSLPGCSHRAKRFPGNDGQQAKEAGEEESGVSGEKAASSSKIIGNPGIRPQAGCHQHAPQDAGEDGDGEGGAAKLAGGEAIRLQQFRLAAFLQTPGHTGPQQ